MVDAAQKAKNKGNAAFRAQQYADAVGHYSVAIVADNKDPTIPLNRAFAYLKLGKYLDAERDCSSVLRLSPRHVKALYRRAQARAELNRLNDAKDDLRVALKAEPNNEAVKTELARVESLLTKAISSNESHTPSRRRRVPIEIIEGPSTSSHPSTQPISNHTPPDEFSDNSPQVIRENRHQPIPQTTTPRGGIFRSSGEQKMFGVPDALTSSSSARSLPISLFDFTRSWELATVQERWTLLSRIPHSQLPTLFKTSLEASLLGEILETLLVALRDEDTETTRTRVKEYLSSLSRVPRFSTVVLFLSREEKERGRQLGKSVGEERWMRI